MNYGKINPVDIANGPGVRVSLFVSGCNHHCKDCFNPETWDFEYGKPYSVLDTMRIVEMCKPDYIAGLSILGGEPLDPKNIDAITLLCKAFQVRHPKKTIWLYTGYEWEHIKHLYIMRYIDVVVDGPFFADKKELTLRFRGSSNQRIIDVQESLKWGVPVLWEDKP